MLDSRDVSLEQSAKDVNELQEFQILSLNLQFVFQIQSLKEF